MNDILNCLKLRSAWYDKAIKMVSHEIEFENGFDWPSTFGGTAPTQTVNIPYWKGCKQEIYNTINMIEADIRRGTI